MNLEESTNYQKKFEKENRPKKVVMLSIIFCAILVALLFVLIIIVKKIDASTMKFFIDGKQQNYSDQELRSNIQNIKNEGYYFNLKFLGRLFGYKYTKGEYGNFNENEDSCYLQDDYEVIAITADQEYYYKELITSIDSSGNGNGDDKITTKNKSGYREIFFVDKPVKLINEELWVSIDYLEDMFNINVDWRNEFRLRIYTLSYRISEAQQNLYSKYGYPNKSGNIDGSFENLKALIDGYVVVRETSGNHTLYGVYNYIDKEQVIGVKYKNIVYAQNIKEFFVTAEDDTMGLWDSSGKEIIPVKNYSKISILDEKRHLYLVEKNKQFGIVDKSGKEIVFPEYDKIGLDVSKFKANKLTSGYLLFDKYIPCYKQNDEGDFKYSLLDIEGNKVQNSICDSYGYISPNESNREQSILLIPESVGIKGIVYRFNDKYGIFLVPDERIIPASYEKIYLSAKDGKEEYYVELESDEILLKDKLREIGVIK